MANTINPNSPLNLPPGVNPTGPFTPPVMTVESMEQMLGNSSPAQIHSMRTLFVQKKEVEASVRAANYRQDPNEAIRAVDNDPRVKHLDTTISEYEAGRASITDLAQAFMAVDGMG